LIKTIELRTILEKLKEDPSISSDTKTRIRGILKKQTSSLYVLFNLNVTQKLVFLLGKFSKELQAVDMSPDYALYSLRLSLQRLNEMRCETEFKRILDEAKNVPGVDKKANRRQGKISRV
jgi:hypothetical protein